MPRKMSPVRWTPGAGGDQGQEVAQAQDDDPVAAVPAVGDDGDILAGITDGLRQGFVDVQPLGAFGLQMDGEGGTDHVRAIRAAPVLGAASGGIASVCEPGGQLFLRLFMLKPPRATLARWSLEESRRSRPPNGEIFGIFGRILAASLA